MRPAGRSSQPYWKDVFMRKLVTSFAALVGAALLLAPGFAQPPNGRPPREPGKEKAKDYAKSSIVTRMMAFNKKGDGKLTKDEVTDPRLHRLFDQADTNKDGIVTREELIALAEKLDAEVGADDNPRGPGPGRPGRGPEGFGPPRPGEILPRPLQERLNLSEKQKKQLDALQKEVDSKLAKILTNEQRKQLAEMRGRGGPGGPPPDGPGGPPPGGPGGRPARPGGDRPPE
jgi:hypothetical protein